MDSLLLWLAGLILGFVFLRLILANTKFLTDKRDGSFVVTFLGRRII